MAQSANEVQLKPETLTAFDTYIRDAEVAMEQTLHRAEAFLWIDGDPERAEQVRRGETIAQLRSGRTPAKVPDGLVHDWIGATRIPDATVESVLTFIQNYDNHANVYKPEVVASKLLSRKDNDFEIYLRLLKKKIITVVLDTEHSVHYRAIDKSRWTCTSYTTRVAEVENPGTAREKVLPADTGYGFLWRLYSYWRFAEQDSGVDVECRAISLTRDVPVGLGWIIEPVIQKLPKESLIHTLECTRQRLKTAVTN